MEVDENVNIIMQMKSYFVSSFRHDSCLCYVVYVFTVQSMEKNTYTEPYFFVLS